jgi:hypothetical protein
MRAANGSTTRGRLRARWLGPIVLLTVAAAQPLPAFAQDQGAAERWVLVLDASTDRSVDDLCVGDIVNIDVRAQRILANQRVPTEADARPAAYVPGVKIKAASGNPEAGSLNPTERATTTTASPPGSARFVFQATHSGTTFIEFTGTEVQRTWAGVPTGIDLYLPTELEVTVKDCDYVVYATYQWHLQTTAAGGFDYTASVGEVMKSDSPGHYTASGTWQLVKTENPGVKGCPWHSRFVEAPVTLTGEVEGDQLKVEVSYKPARVNWATTGSRALGCIYPQGTVTYAAFPENLKFSVPLGGSTLKLSQTLTSYDEGYVRGGVTVVTVERVPPQ